MFRRSLIVVVLAAAVAACNGGSTAPPTIGTGTLVTPSPTPSPTPNPATATGTLTTSTTASSSLTLGPIGPGDMGSAGCPVSSAISHLTVVFSLTQPGGTPAVASMKRRPQNIGGAALTPFGFYTVTPDVTVNCPNTPAFTMTFPTGVTPPSGGSSYIAMFDPSNAAAGWNTITGPGTVTGNTISWTTSGFTFSLVAGRTYSFVLFTTSSTLTLFTPSPTPTPTATPIPLHLYVGNDNAGGPVLQFNLPLTASTTSNFAIVSNNVVTVGVDANGNLAVGDNAGNLQFFTAPLSGASVPAAAFKNGAASNNGNASFLNTGDFWAATVSNRVNRFNSPFSNASVPAAFVTDAGMVSDIGTAIDAAQNLYISNAGTGNAAACAGTSSPGGGCGSNLYVYAPPYTGAPVITPSVINYPFGSASTAYRKIAVNATRLYAASVANAPGRVDVYNLPITAASTPAFNLQSGVNTPEGLALDPAGNLYIGNLSDATVTVYTAPITASSVPSLIYKVSTGAFAIFGIAVGK
jgi:hypothetical protein